MDSIHWTRKADIKFTTSARMLAESIIRDQVIASLGSFTGAVTSVFGGACRQGVLSEHTIKHNPELQDGLNEFPEAISHHWFGSDKIRLQAVCGSVWHHF